MKEYPRTFTEQSSYGSALRLLDRAGITEGVVLDLGCGRSPLAEPLAERGLTHVGCDIDVDALADLAERGSETHPLSLLADADDLVAGLEQVLAGRPLAAVLALDVLEHLPDPVDTLLAVRRFVLGLHDGPGPVAAPLVVSIPNVTHADVGAKLLLGRWDVDDTGLLDDTHLRFFGEHELHRLLVAGGWAAADVEDVALALSDQASPTDAPTIRPDAPLRELVRAVRGRADAHAETYQFVRRLEPTEPAPAPYNVQVDEERPLIEAVIVTGPGTDTKAETALRADLSVQEPPIATVRTVARDDLDDALHQCEGRWVAVLDASTRLAPGWSAAVAGMAEVGAGRVICVGAVVVTDAELAALPSPVDPSGVDGGLLDAGAFDLLHVAPPSFVGPSAYLVPVEVILTAGLVPGSPKPMGLERWLWLARAAMVSGMASIDRPLVVLGSSQLVAPGAAPLVTEALDDEPLLLPGGSASRLSDLRERVLAAEEALGAAEENTAVALHRAAHYTAHVARYKAERDDYLEELDLLRSAHRQRLSQRLLAPVRRLAAQWRRRRPQLG